MITVACVWNGNKYQLEYVIKLRNMVARNLHEDHYFFCLTDKPDALPSDIPGVQSKYPTWWAKMELFSPSIRGNNRTLYLDLDMVVVGDLYPLASLDCDFGICENFTRLAGHKNWPCKYGSCCMVFAPEWGQHVYGEFSRNASMYMRECDKGDQQAIERIYPNATLLQHELPENYFVGYRDMTQEKPDGCAVGVFGGRRNPHNTDISWAREAWV